MTAAWIDYFHADNVRAFASTTDRPADARKRVAQLCNGLARHRGADKKVRALIAGCPNVGKSTLINTLVGRNIAKTGDKPAVTKEQQAFVLPNGMTITDSPGLMSPRSRTSSARFASRSPARSRRPRSTI